MATVIDAPEKDRDSDVSTDPCEQPKNDGSIAREGSRTLGLGFLWGIVFGFLLQKGGVAKFNILIGQLILEDFTVVKIMLSAVVVGMIGIHFLHHRGLVELHIKPTRYASNVIGGLIFGVGFGLAAYCPGTGAAAIGQGNLDAIAMVFGMIGGSWLYAEASGWISRHVDPVGDRGKLTVYDLIPAKRVLVTIGAAAILIVVLGTIELLDAS